MNCLHNHKFYEIQRYVKKHFKNFMIKIFCLLNLISLLYCMLLVDYFTSWKPWIIICSNVLFIY